MSAGLDARRAAAALLNGVLDERRLMAELLPGPLARLAPEERARALRLANGTLRWMDRADRLLGPHLRRRPAEPVMTLLRLGSYEIAGEGAAAHGVVNAMVELARTTPHLAAMAGLVNAVLRRIAEGGSEGWDALPVPRLPKWLRRVLVEDFGKDAIAGIEAAHVVPPPIDLTPKGASAAVAARVGGRVLPTGSVRVGAGAQVTALPGFAEGEWWVQDAAAAVPVRVLAPRRGMRVLDLCAAPGGKTMQMAAAGAEVTALDVSPARLERLHENLARTRLNAQVVAADALDWSPGDGTRFDAVLLDAPCSATGTIRRHPDLPHAKDGGDFPQLFELQARMIDRALDLLAPGGRLVFCTCSLLIDEGEEQVRDALERHPGLRVDHGALAAAGLDRDWIGPEGLRLRPDYWPQWGGMDGFFVTALTRRG